MSFTLYKKKTTGEMVPIKMSIWDAFHGCPNPKPRKKDPCSCCGKYHGMTDKAKQQFDQDECFRNGGTGIPGRRIDWKGKNKINGDGKDSSKSNKRGDDNKQGGYSTSAEETFSEADDVIIVNMKNDGESWAKILQAIGKSSKSQVQARYKQLEGKPMPDKTGDRRAEKAIKDADKKAKAENNRDDGLKKQAEGTKEKAGKGKKNKAKGQEKKDEKRSDGDGDDSAVKAWASRYDKQKWVAMASKHFDKTGQRITPEQARKLAGGR